MSVALPIFEEIRSQCRKKSVQLKDLIGDLDAKNCGKITTYRFQKLFSLLSIWIEQSKFNQIANLYRIPGTDFIDVNKFYSDFENQPKDDEHVTDEELRNFAKQFVIQNTTIEDCVRPQDKFHSGHVSIDGFLNVFGTSPFTKRLARQYSHLPTNDVYYLDFARDVDRVLKENPLSETTLRREIKDLPPYFRDMAINMRMKGVDPMQTLSSHDKFKKMTILPAHFVADADRLGINLSIHQIREIQDAFTVDGRFDYVAFCDAVNRETEGSFKMQPILSESSYRPPTEKIQTEVVITPADINTVLKNLQCTILDRHSLVGDRLAHFDQFNSGKLSEKQFFKIFEAEKFVIRDDEKLAIINEFSDGNGNINYRAFMLAVLPQPANPITEADAIYDRLKEHLQQKQIRIHPYFERVDSDNLGYVSFAQLLAIFRNVQFDINLRERKLLRASTGNDVNIESFCSRVDPAVLDTELRIEKKVEEEERNEDLEIPDKSVTDALARLASVIDHENLEIIDEFRRYESSPLIRPSNFRSVLLGLPVRISESDIDLFIENYTDKPSRLVDTIRLIQDIEKYGRDQLKIEPDLSLTTSIEFTEPSQYIKRILRKLKVVLLNKNLRGSALFRPYDQSSLGFVSKDRLHSIFENIGFMNQISEDDLIQLEAAFQPNKLPDLFNYRRMLICLDSQEVNNEDYATVTVNRTDSFTGDHALVNLANTIHSKLQARRKKADSVFLDCTDSPIPYNEFRQRVMNYGLIISPTDMQLLNRSYRANMKGDIDWKSFCHDVDSIKTVQPLFF